MFPSALPTLTNPTTGSNTNSPSHAQQHADANDNIEALCAKLGIGAATPVANRLLTGTGAGTSDWSKVSPNGTIVGTTDTQTLMNKTLTSPTINTPTIVNPTLQTDTISEYTSAAGVTVDGLLIKDGAIASSGLPSGAIVQTAITTYSSVSTGTTIIPKDDTIPQNTEGNEFMSISFNPKSATNKLIIEAVVTISSSVADWLIAALFQDSGANAIAANASYQATATGTHIVKVKHDMVAGTTSSTTFKIRAGGANAGTRTFNGDAGNRLFGAIPKSSISIMEYKV